MDNGDFETQVYILHLFWRLSSVSEENLYQDDIHKLLQMKKYNTYIMKCIVSTDLNVAYKAIMLLKSILNYIKK